MFCHFSQILDIFPEIWSYRTQACCWLIRLPGLHAHARSTKGLEEHSRIYWRKKGPAAKDSMKWRRNAFQITLRNHPDSMFGCKVEVSLLKEVPLEAQFSFVLRSKMPSSLTAERLTFGAWQKNSGAVFWSWSAKMQSQGQRSAR